MRRTSTLTILTVVSAGLWAATALAKPPGNQPPKPIEVVNPPSDPVLVLDVGTPAREPFQDETQIQVSGFLHEPLYTVPPGKRAVIRTVTVLVTFPNPVGVGGILAVETEVGGQNADHHLVLTSQGTVLTSEARTANAAVTLFADAGTQVFLNGAIEAGSVIFVSLSGYLEEVP